MRQLIVGSAVLLTIASHASSAEPPKDVTNSIGMKFKLIPAGEFMMGSSESPSKLAKAFTTRMWYIRDCMVSAALLAIPHAPGAAESSHGQ